MSELTPELRAAIVRTLHQASTPSRGRLVNTPVRLT
jgi:hypothetical protein